LKTILEPIAKKNFKDLDKERVQGPGR